MRPDRQYQGLQQTAILAAMPDPEVGLDPNRFEGSFSDAELLDRGDESSSLRHAQRPCWELDRDGGLTDHHCTKKTGKKRAFWSTIWSEKSSSQMDETVWVTADPSGPLGGSGELSIIDTPKPTADSTPSVAGESNSSPSECIAKEAAKLVIEDDDSGNGSITEPDKSGEKIVRSRSTSICSSGPCSGTGMFSREHVISQSQLLVQYVDHLESISWDDDQSSVLGVLLEMMTAVNHHVSSADESIANDHEEHANLQAEIRREKSQIKALVKELFGELSEAELGHLLLSQLDQ